MQTELHHVRTLKIMSDVYSRGMMTELLFEQQTVEKLFPCLDELISIHSQFFQKILERKKDSLVDKSERNFLIKRMGDVLVNQVSHGKGLSTQWGKKRSFGVQEASIYILAVPATFVSSGKLFCLPEPQFPVP